MRRDTDKLEGGFVLLTYCVFGAGGSLLILLRGWNRANMELRGTCVVIALLSIFGIYKAVRFLARETADKVEYDKEKVIHFMDLDTRKTRILIVSRVLLVCMLVGVIVLFDFLFGPGTPDIPMSEAPMSMWIKLIAIFFLGSVLVFVMDRTEKKFEQLINMYKFFGRTAIRISFAGNGNTPLPAGCSKYGGRPDVADDFQWPHDNSGRPLTFLLQIDCVDLATLDREGLLPASGQLYFFYELSKMNRGGLKNAVRVIYNDKPSSQLHPLDYPVNLGKEYQLQECRLKFIRCTSIPRIEELRHLTSLDEEDESEYYDVYMRLYDKFWKGDGPIGKMLGYADLIQGPIVNDLSNEVLLLELYSSKDDRTPHDLPLGNSFIYFYIKREDLQARRFDSIKFARQFDNPPSHRYDNPINQ